MKRFLSILLASAVIGFAVAPADATLYDRGGGMIYDSDLNITWLSDANYAQTSGYDADGMMAWSDAVTWANNLVYGGYSDWRLPTALNQDGSGPCWGVNCTGSEMGHLFYNELGASGGTPISLGWTNPSFALFSNLLDASYWAGTDAAAQGDASKAWDFSFYSGDTYAYPKVFGFFAMAVRPGDVAAASVPEPGTLMLMGTGLAGLIATRKRFMRRLG